MKTKFTPFSLQDKPIFIAAKKIVQILSANKKTAYFVGGAVRDAILNKEIEEIDIATSATPTEIMEIFPVHKSVGAHFGVILVHIEGFTFDVATFRSDGQYKDGRRPESIQFTDPEHDAKRRDFSINGLFYNPLDDTIIDFVGGLQDIYNKTINTIGDAQDRFEEDKLRMLRCIRFSTQLKQNGFTINPFVIQQIEKQSRDIIQVSQERVREEIIKTFQYASNYLDISLLFTTHLSHFIFPLKTNPSFQAIQLFNTLISDSSIPFVLLYFSLFIEDFHQSCSVGSIKKQFLLTTKECELMESILSWLFILSNWEDLSSAEKKRSLRYENIDIILKFLENWEPFYTKNKIILPDIKQYYQLNKSNLYPPQFISGYTLIQKGISPSPLFKVILEEIETQQLEGNIHTYEESLLYLEELLAQYQKGSDD